MKCKWREAALDIGDEWGGAPPYYDSFTVEEWLAWMRLLIADHWAERANHAHKPFPIDPNAP